MGRDPYRYFRVEAREIVEGLSRAALSIEKGAGGHEVVVQMLRLAHTLKGAARIVKQPRIAELSHAVEELLAPHGSTHSGNAAPTLAEPLLRTLDQISACLAGLEALPVPSEHLGARGPSTPESLQSARIDVAEMDRLLEGLSEATLRVADVRRELDELSRARTIAAMLVDQLRDSARHRASAEELRSILARVERNAMAGVDRVDREIEEVHCRAHDLRLLPSSEIFSALERAARDVAHAVEREIAFEASGGECRLEANVLFALRDALLHVVRNAVAHGIEPLPERKLAGKPPTGRVSLRVERRGNRVAFVCADDGRGIDPKAIRRVAIERGVTTAAAAAAMSAEGILRLVLENGVTTSASVTEIAGRGVGLEVVRSTTEKLNGHVKVTSHLGVGTTIDLCVPVSISSISALVLDVQGTAFAIPLDAVLRSRRVALNDLVRLGDHDSIIIDGAAVPFLLLASVLRGDTPLRDRGEHSWSGIVVTAGGRTAVLGADRLLSTSNIVLRPLPRAAGAIPMIAGVSLDADGNPQLVLDPQGLVAVAHGRHATARGAARAEPPAPVLIVDDSLTTRMLEQSILESAGYAVEVAISAEEGLTRAREAAHSLFLVDVEMPGIDGFEFVARTRQDADLRKVPAIMVSSRDAPEDRRRAEEVGARAYIVKGEFDQGRFLQTIRQLIG